MIGIFGGTFDPIHLGHLHVATELLKKLSLEKIIFLPVGTPAHRSPPVASAKQRLAMIRLALADNPKFAVDEHELEKNSPSYTVDSLAYFKAQYPHSDLAFIMGADAFAHFTQWHEWKRILTLCTLIVVNRPESSPAEPPAADNIQQVSIEPCGISSTAIRAGEISEATLPASVAEYIQAEKLYFI
jgi:nicotinate-nucleotide adenylyltransferase